MCGRFLPAGTLIEWSKSAGATCAGGCSGKAAKAPAPARKPSAPAKAGVCSAPAGGASLTTLRTGKIDPAGELGRVFRAGPRAGAVSGLVVFVTGAERFYETDEFNEDAGDMQGGGWGRVFYVRPATDAEAAPVLAAEAEAATRKAAAEAAEKARRAEEEAAWTAFRAARDLPGLVSLEGHGWQLVASRGEELAYAETATRDGHVSGWARLSRATLCDGTEVLVESTANGDDWRDNLWVPQDTADRVYRALQVWSLGTTPEAAKEWLSKYQACYGAGYYKWVAGQGKAA